MSKRDTLNELGFEDAIVFDNPDYDKAIIGTTEDRRVVYSFYKMVECLTEEDGMSEEDAIDFICYNTIRALPYWPTGPIVMYDDIEGEFQDSAIVGMSSDDEPIYSYEKVIEKIMQEKALDYDGAADYFSYNESYLPSSRILLMNEKQIEFGEEVDKREEDQNKTE